MKQTAVEWLVEQLKTMDTKSFNRLIQIEMSRENFEECFEQAKAMEKEQIMDAYTADCDTLGHTNAFKVAEEQYYNETYLQTHTPKHYRVWFPDTMEAAGGYWWHAVTDSCGRLYDPKHPNEERDTVQWYIDNGYKIEEVING